MTITITIEDIPNSLYSKITVDDGQKPEITYTIPKQISDLITTITSSGLYSRANAPRIITVPS